MFQWMDSALCAQIGHELFETSTLAALAVCARCPVQAECLAHALTWPTEDADSDAMIYAATTPTARQRIKKGTP